MENFEDNLNWMNEKIEALPYTNWLYKLMCFISFRPKKKFTYKEMYLILSRMNEKSIGSEEAKTFAMNRIIDTYKFNNKD